ncbi:hypothetical protein PENSUB_13381 [Penicillium subrubescens]|uniref:Uncharacterized protein n=2 Tax=Penicillium subrubescens TaxID=1316194 RepID=A0A1Q5SRP2_9EURO|nr:hypothetical protein PENSUB_13381 [Penicillium subrubescens]
MEPNIEPNSILSVRGHQYPATTNFGNLHQGDHYETVNHIYNQEQDHAAAAICAVLHQLFCAREDLFQKHAKKVVEQHGDYLKADFDALWQLLLSVVSDPSAGKVICILDALDECREPDRGRLIQGLELFYKLTLKLVRNNLGQTKKKLLKQINDLPQDVNTAYERILERCNGRNKQAGRRLLKIIVAARRPLRLSEIDVMLEIDTDSKYCSDLDLEGPSKREVWICDACGLFVKILDSRVYLIHQTARDFLLRREGEMVTQGKWQHSIDLQDAHLTLAKLCIVYLLLDDFRRDYRSRREDSKAEHGFLLYSANYWVSHTQQAGLIELDWVEKIAKLCEINDGSVSFWLGYHSDRLSWEKGIHEQQPPLFWAAQWGLVQIVAFFLDNHEMKITEDVIKTAVSNHENGKAILELLLGQKGAGFQITDGVLQAAAANRGDASHMMKSLLARESPNKITKEVIRTAIRNARCGQEVLKILLGYPEANTEITDKIIMAVAYNQENGIHMLEMLLDRSSIKITDDGLKAAASSGHAGKIMMKLLLEKRSPDIQLIHELFKIAMENSGSGDGVIKVLLDHRGADIFVTSEMIQAIVTNEQNGAATLKVLLDERGASVKITDEVVNMALENRCNGVLLIKLLLKYRGPGIIKDDMIHAIAASDRSEVAMINLLLEQRQDFKITDDLISEALRNERCGGAVVKVLLAKRGAPLHIDDQIIQAVSANELARCDLIDILLQQGDVIIKCTENIIRMAVEDEAIQYAVERLLFESGTELSFRVTDEMLEMAMPIPTLQAELRVARMEQDMKRYVESRGGLPAVGMGSMRIPRAGQPAHPAHPENPRYFELFGGFAGFGAFEDSERFEWFEGSDGSEGFEDFEDSEDAEET